MNPYASSFTPGGPANVGVLFTPYSHYPDPDDSSLNGSNGSNSEGYFEVSNFCEPNVPLDGIASVAFDPYEELLWAGSSSVRLSSCFLSDFPFSSLHWNHQVFLFFDAERRGFVRLQFCFETSLSFEPLYFVICPCCLFLSFASLPHCFFFGRHSSSLLTVCLFTFQGRLVSYSSPSMSKYTAWRPSYDAIRKILVSENGVVALSSSSAKCYTKGGLTLSTFTFVLQSADYPRVQTYLFPFRSPENVDLQTMMFTNARQTELLVAGLSETMYLVDLKRGKVQKEVR